MSNNNTGGPAFPSHHDDEFGYSAKGMTVRDYFAAKAMQAIMGSDRYVGIIGVNNYQHRVASDAYAMADAMLKAGAA